MSQALTGPYLLAAAVLCLAGAAKLRSPHSAAAALASLGPRVPAVAVRAGALLELALGAAALVSPSRLGGVVAVLYGAFTVLTVFLWRRGESCGCFGASESATTPLQIGLGLALAGCAGLGAGGGAHGLAWVLGRSPASSATLLLGVAAAAYGVALAYSALPEAWGAWSPR